MLRSTLYIIILSATFGSVILSLALVSGENIKEKENLQKYLEEYKQWARGEISKYQDYSESLKLQIDGLTAEKSALSKQYDSVYYEYEDLLTSKQSLQKQYDQEKKLFKQEKSSFEGALQSQQKELEAQGKELEQLERAQIEEMARTNPLVAGLIDGKLKYYVEPVPDYASSDTELGIKIFTEFFEDRNFFTTGAKFKRVYDRNDAALEVSWIKNYGSHVVGESIFKSVIKVGLGSDNCYGQWQPFTARTVMIIFMHEMGHSMGFGHSDNPDNMMYYKTDTIFVTDYDETLVLDEGEYYTLPFCHGGTTSYQVLSYDKLNGFYVYVLPPETDSTNFIDYGIGKPLPDCSTEKLWTAYTNTCDIPDGAKLVIYNPIGLNNFDVIRVDVKIVNVNEIKFPDSMWDMSVFEYDQTWLNQIWNMYH